MYIYIYYEYIIVIIIIYIYIYVYIHMDICLLSVFFEQCERRKQMLFEILAFSLSHTLNVVDLVEPCTAHQLRKFAPPVVWFPETEVELWQVSSGSQGCFLFVAGKFPEEIQR